MLQLHRSERADPLVEALGALLADPLPDPLQSEVVAVPTCGVERWLSQRLSVRLGAGDSGGGICANVEFPSPWSLLRAVSARAAGYDPASDPWMPERLVWPLVELIDSQVGIDESLGPLAEHLRSATPPARDGSERRPRRFALARHLAALYDRYAEERPEMLLAWADGSGGEHSGHWQAHLWRGLRARLASPSPPERLASATDVIRSGADVGLPSRISLFGLTRLSASQMDVLEALGGEIDVHLFLLHPSGRLWETTEANSRTVGHVPPRRPMFRYPGRHDPLAAASTNPLLRSWARDAREMQAVLTARGFTGGIHHPVPEGVSISRLHRLQESVRHDTLPGPDPSGGAGRSAPAPGVDPPDAATQTDRSLQIHSCHGRARQVEVLRDALLHLFATDDTLEPRHVIVMCPDIEVFAPLIQAVFGPAPLVDDGDGAGAPLELPVRLADRSLLQTNPLLSVAGLLVELARSRVTASEVVDLASHPAVSLRFGFRPEDLGVIERWVARSGVRWGLDTGHRRAWGLDPLAGNTWAAGLDGLLLGVAMTEDGAATFGGAVPCEEVGGGSMDLLGRLAEMVGRLRSAVGRLCGPRPVVEWVEDLVDATSSLARATSGEEWQHDELRATLLEVAAEAAERTSVELSIEELRECLASRLAGRPTRANFRTGEITFCTLLPMRSVPHRVVALLGLDDGVFPRHPEQDGDDLTLMDPRIGERDSRSEDRQLLLDALMAAEDHLVITYSGRDERTNRQRPPCAPVAELLDVVSRMDGSDARAGVVVEHPLQPFDPRNFQPGELGSPGPWSFDSLQAGAARAALRQRPPGPWLSGPLPGLVEDTVELGQLVSFLQGPVKAFLRRRLSLYLAPTEDALVDHLPLELDPLERWEVGDRLLSRIIAGVAPEDALAAESARGLIPPGRLGDPLLDDVMESVRLISDQLAALSLLDGPAESRLVSVTLPSGVGVTGEIPGIRRGSVVQTVFSRLAAKHRIAAWVRLLAATVQDPGTETMAVSIGRGGSSRRQVAVSALSVPGGDPGRREAWAQGHLQALVDLYAEGMRAPLPMACATSAAWAGAMYGSGDAEAATRAAEGEWSSTGLVPMERDQPEYVHLYGRWAPLSALMEARPLASEEGPGWPPGRSRFAVLAQRVWEPVLASEKLIRVDAP